MRKPIPFYLTAKELCDYLKISRTTFERMKKRGELPVFKVGGAWRISSVALIDWMAEAKKKRNPS